MATYMIKVAGEGLVNKAHRNSDIGPTSGSSVIYQINEVPEGLSVDDVIVVFKKFTPPANTYEFDYASLLG